jgi:hypothetical protein
MSCTYVYFDNTKKCTQSKLDNEPYCLIHQYLVTEYKNKQLTDKNADLIAEIAGLSYENEKFRAENISLNEKFRKAMEGIKRANKKITELKNENTELKLKTQTCDTSNQSNTMDRVWTTIERDTTTNNTSSDSTAPAFGSVFGSNLAFGSTSSFGPQTETSTSARTAPVNPNKRARISDYLDTTHTMYKKYKDSFEKVRAKLVRIKNEENDKNVDECLDLAIAKLDEHIEVAKKYLPQPVV